jgi:predicted CXXCH cytochrome family protein
MMMIIMLMAGQAWAAVAVAPSSLSLATNSSTGSYTVSLGASSTPGANYVVEESTDNFATAPTVYALGTLKVKSFSKANGTYYYRAYVTAAGYTQSPTTVTKNIVVLLTAVAPSSLSVASTSSTGNYSVTIGTTSTAGASYVLEESTDNFATAPTVYNLGISRVKGFSAKASNTYAYRAKAIKAGWADSAYTATGTIVVNWGLAAPASLTVPASSANGSFVVSIGESSSAGASYVLEESADNFATAPTVYALGTLRSKALSGKAGVLYFRAKVTKAGYPDSAYTTTQSIAVANSSTCNTCHDDVQTILAATRHGNGNASPRGFDNQCATCHGPTAELNASGNMSVTCTACHGASSADPTHTATIVAAANASPLCNNCHSGDHLGLGKAITEKVAASKHDITTSGHSGSCGRCHTQEGYLAFDAGTESYGAVSTTAYNGTTNVSCAACHDPHTSALRVPRGWNVGSAQYNLCTSCHNLTDASGTPIASGLTVSGQATLPKQQHSKDWFRNIASTHYDLTTTGVGSASTVIEGYAVRKNSATACTDCHGHELYTNTGGVSGAVPTAGTIHTDWAQSAHAGGLLTAKKALYATQGYSRTTTNAAAIMAVGVDGTSGPAWEHYDWDKTYKADGSDAGTDPDDDRAQCQRCHTSTGISNFLTNPAAYNPINNDFSHLVGWVGTPGTKSVTTGSKQNELLYCWGCHKSVETGELRNPGAITETYAAATTGSPTATVTYPDINQSNVCMGCHLGREVGQNVANDIDADGVRGFINSHYLTAGATIFNESGYEFAGQDYSSYGYHKNVGMNDAFGTGTAGPCVTCHMTGSGSHSFKALNASGAPATTECSKCHGGLTNTVLTASEEEFALAMDQLKAALAAKRIMFSTANPYFFYDANNNGVLDAFNEDVNGNLTLDAGEDLDQDGVIDTSETTIAFTNWAGVYGLAKWRDVMGAAFNYNLLEHDPGAFAHNHQYGLKLIADSIDFLADGTVDGLGIPTAVTNAIASKEFAETTSHPAGIVTAANSTNCGICHSNAPHYGGSFGGNAQYVANNAVCSDCHNGGDTTANGTILVQYAESGHGAATGAAWKTSASHDWPNAATCKNCHSTTGFTALISGSSRGAVTAGAGQVLACDACHTSVADGALRPAGQVTTYYKQRTYNTGSSTWNAAAFAVFPNVGTGNNVCINCHSGRESGESILAIADASMNNVSFKNPHYLGAAGMMYAKLAFIDFTSRDTVIGTSTYGKSLTANEDGGLLSSTHRKLGTAAISSDTHKNAYGVVTAKFLTTGGPCVTCHMARGAEATADGSNVPAYGVDHTWEIARQDVIDNVCAHCHSSEVSDIPTLDFFLEEQAIPFNDAIDLAIAKLKANFKIDYSEAYPYFMEEGTTTAVKDWTRATALGSALSAADAKKLMGACLNIKLMKADPAAYVHARTYARRVLYDTIDWLDNQAIDMSTGATAIAWSPTKYVKDATAGGTTTESFKYLAGYDRTTLAWNALERP